uniref:Uncharacterized protein n=1 Tax=Aegilops tauschii subsp. strangulata TaxID=200361 RepID=A0A453HLG8_AEGTS
EAVCTRLQSSFLVVPAMIWDRQEKWALLLGLQSFSLHLVIVSEPDVHDDSTDLLRRIHVDLAKQKDKGIHADSCTMILSSVSCSWIYLFIFGSGES